MRKKFISQKQGVFVYMFIGCLSWNYPRNFVCTFNLGTLCIFVINWAFAQLKDFYLFVFQIRMGKYWNLNHYNCSIKWSTHQLNFHLVILHHVMLTFIKIKCLLISVFPKNTHKKIRPESLYYHEIIYIGCINLLSRQEVLLRQRTCRYLLLILHKNL